MFVQCPACHQRNPQNAKECLHCNQRLAPQANRSALDAMLDSADPDSPGTKRWLNLLATVVGLGLVGALIYGYLYGPQSECVRESDRAYIAELESQGYICEVDVFHDDRRMRRDPNKPGEVKIGFRRTDRRDRQDRRGRRVCCTLPQAEEP